MELASQRDLCLLLKLAESCGRDLVLYFFGSVARQKQDPDDIDVLAIYERESSILEFRNRSSRIDFPRPLHLIAMTPAEEAFYNFIVRTDARRIAKHIEAN
jgi:predicted nucleotidyltransferase